MAGRPRGNDGQGAGVNSRRSAKQNNRSKGGE
jgi:hypothetical protein